MMKYYRSFIVVVMDVLILIFTDWLSLAVRFDFLFSSIPARYIVLMRQIMPWQIALTLAIFYLFKMYHFIWRAVTVQDVARMMIAVLTAYAACLAMELLFFTRLPLSTYFAMLVLQIVLFCSMRCVFRFTKLISERARAGKAGSDRESPGREAGVLY